MVGPGGCFFLDSARAATLEPARGLIELLAADVAIVLVSGRSREQLLEATRIFGADGFIGELGSVIGWDHGRTWEVLPGAMPPDHKGTPYQVLHQLGIVDDLLARYPGRLEYHSPWHAGHEGDVMLRGRVDPAEVESQLVRDGFGWVRFHDNGVLPLRRGETLVAEALPAHVYHLMPDGLSKGEAVARDLLRRGLSPADAVAVGDSVSDLSMAAHVAEIFVVGDPVPPHVESRLAGMTNAVRTGAALGAGWAVAARHAAGSAAAP